MKYYTYAHYAVNGTLFYIGKGSHKRAYSASGRNIVWKNIVEKNNGFITKILASWITEKEAFEHEIFLIETFRKLGYILDNLSSGGEGASGYRHTEAHKLKIKNMMLNKNPMDNLEIRKKQKIELLKAMRRPEVRQHQSKVRMGIPLPKEHIESLKNCHPMSPCIINGILYKSLMEASRQIKIRHGTLYRWLNNPKVKHNSKYSHIVECRWSDSYA